jgi:hypothetical protein
MEAILSIVAAYESAFLVIRAGWVGRSSRMRPSGIPAAPTRQFDVSLLFIVAMLVFVSISVAQFCGAWNDAQRGLLLYERTCPLNAEGVETKG